MPRTIPAECPGCPPIRVLTTDELGLIKVIETSGKASIPKVVERWGKPDASSHVLLASMVDSSTNPLLAIGRRNNLVELLNPLNGDILATENLSEVIPDSQSAQDNKLAALHLFRTGRSDYRSNTILMCTENGSACLRSVTLNDGPSNSTNEESLKTWNVSKAGKVLCSSVSGFENHVLFAGKGIEVNLWDLERSEKVWNAKSPPCNSLGIFTPAWFTAATFLCKDDHRKIITGTNNHQIRLYDASAQRRPVVSIDFRESPIKAVTKDPNGHKIYAGTGSGDLASFDMRTGKMLGCFIGKCSGSIRSIARHPELPVVVSCGLDRYVRFWDSEKRQLLSTVFLKQILTKVLIDSKFSDEGNASNSTKEQCEPIVTDQSEVDNPDEENISSRKKQSRTSENTINFDKNILSNEAGKRTSLNMETSRKTKHKRRKRPVDDDE